MINQMPEDLPPAADSPLPMQRRVIGIEIEFPGEAEEIGRIAADFAAQAQGFIRDLAILHLGPDRVGSVHVRIAARRRFPFNFWQK